MLLAACGGHHSRPERAAPLNRAGPAADYPMITGEPFTIDGVTYKPVDAMNYDAVGRAVADPEGGAGVSAAHKTLPLPSYAEVTSLETGRTILVRVERRGPMVNDRLIALSAGALAQLGAEGRETVPVRVRRVNPPETDRALLRTGQAAPQRMDTPASLLGVLMRKLDPQAVPAVPPVAAAPSAQPTVAAAPEPKPVPPARAVTRGPLVQIAAFSTKDRAEAVASSMGATVTHAGRFWKVRMGPFATQAEAAAALAKARAAGYSDARIQRAD
jgi:rare lipoprotein A